MLVIFYFEDSFRWNMKDMCEEEKKKTRRIEEESVFKSFLIARKMRVTGEFNEQMRWPNRKIRRIHNRDNIKRHERSR